jgi:hypothetical protein
VSFTPDIMGSAAPKENIGARYEIYEPLRNAAQRGAVLPTPS